jgi:acid phosphatase
MGIYTAPYVLSYKASGSSLNTYLSLNPGTYYTDVQEWDNCGGASKTPVTITVSGGTSSVPASSHVFVVVEENHSYSSVIGNSAMPYFNSLASKYGLATKYYANTHPSIGNYFMLTTGQVITNNDSFCSTITNDNVVRHLLTAGKTWKSYAESLPYAGYTGCGSGEYVKRHNPLAYFSDVANSSEKYNLVPFTQFSKDLANNALPQFSFIVPNLLDDAHDGTLQQADYWLKTNIAPLIASPTFQKDGILIIVFDESADSDTAYGGGHVAAVVIGPKVKPGYKSSTLYQHQNTLKTLMEALGVQTYPGAASTAKPTSDVF